MFQVPGAVNARQPAPDDFTDTIQAWLDDQFYSRNSQAIAASYENLWNEKGW